MTVNMGQLKILALPTFASPDAVPSNKPNSIGKLTVTTKKEDGKEAEPPTPFIDRLCVVAILPNKEVAAETKQAHVIATSDQTIFKSAKQAKGFKRAYRIALPSVVSSRALQINCWLAYKLVRKDAQLKANA